MLKRTRLKVALLAIAAVPFLTSMPQADATAEPDCSDGWPKMGCRIWNVTMKLSIKPEFTCQTGGEWKCGSRFLMF